MRRQSTRRRLGVLRLHGEEDALPGAAYFVRQQRRRSDGELFHRTCDAQTVTAYRGDMLGHCIDECDVMSGTLQPCAGRSADGTGAPDQDPLAHYQLSSNARVS